MNDDNNRGYRFKRPATRVERLILIVMIVLGMAYLAYYYLGKLSEGGIL